MRRKQLDARYKHLRTILIRAKEDADKWGTDQPPLLLNGIKNQQADDFSIYENAFEKFKRQRIRRMDGTALETAKTVEKMKTLPLATYSETQLTRIADALERIADILERDQTTRP